ncbi:MAG TPA: ATP-binding protein, partial [Polyangiales bacterium]|nr:ATP-binding protein [Polyangiales bacterium]
MSSRGTLSRQLLALVTGSALVLSIPVAAVNFAISKRQVQAQQQEQVEVVLSLFGLQLRQAVWDFDDRAVHAILAGLAHFPALQSAEVIAPDLHASYTKPGTDGAQAGALQRYTLRSPDESMVIGQLNLRLDRALLEQQVWRRVYRLIFVIGVELLVLVALIFSLMRRSVTRPVLALSQHVQHMTPERLSEPAPLPADGPPNELHELGHGVTRLQLALREQLEQRDAIARTLQESESRLQLMADSIPNQLWTARPNGELDYVSRRAIDYFGLSAEQLIGNGWQAVVHADDLAECLARWSKALETGSEYHVDLRLRRHDGAYRWHAVMAVPKRDATGQIVKWFGSSTDITDRKRSEELLVQSQKMNAVGHLAGGIAHDFNNQLTVILGAAELLERRLTDADSKELTAGILVAAHRCRDLTKNLLAFSRKQPLRQEPVDVHALIQETLQLLERSIDKRIEVVRRLEARASFVRGDATQLQNALLNLALNARDAMPNGGTLELATESLELQERAAKELGLSGGGTYLSVRVSDTGIGMSRETQQQLFEPFFTTKPVGKGTGLGLASVHGTVDSHHGAITVESELGRGTTFTLYLRSSESAFDNE